MFLKMENNEKLKIILEDNLLEKFMINYLQLNDTYDRRYLYVNPLKDFCELIIRYDFFKTMNFKFDYLKDFYVLKI